MTDDRHSFAVSKELLDDPLEIAKREAENGILQFDMVLGLIQNHTKPFRLTARIITELNEIALRGISELAGTTRNTAMEIKGSRHLPPHHLDVPDEISRFCNYVNEKWNEMTAIHLAAYALWKLNWIHPYIDGNGRTARAVSYLLLSVKLGHILPGTPTIPEQIAVDKGPYYDALESSDAALSEKSIVDVSALEGMLEQMLVKQLLSRPSLSDLAKGKLKAIVGRRVGQATNEVKILAYGTSAPIEQLWSVGDHLLLQISNKDSVDAANARQASFGNPFPHLFAIGDASALVHIEEGGVSIISAETNYDVGRDYAISMSRDSSCALGAIGINCEKCEHLSSWASVGSLYVVRLGLRYDSENFTNAFDWLIAKHLNGMAI